MGLFDIFKIKKQNISRHSEKSSLSSPIVLIPNDILRLMWFTDGNLKNIDIDEGEPSAVSIKLPIGQATNEPLGYWPSYTNMTPNQRYNYLHWLTNVDSKTDIGNVFTFFYGLERWIKSEKHEQAINMIIRLKKAHNYNDSFNYYSNISLIYAALVYKNPNYLAEIIPEKNATLLLLARGSFSKKLSASDIMNTSKSFNWDNLRYIKNNSTLFKENLESLLIKNYSDKYYPIPNDIGEVPMISLQLSNTSLSSQTSSQVIKSNNIDVKITTQFNGPLTVSIPDFSQSKRIMVDIYSLLQTAHNMTKNNLKELRKNSTSKSKDSENKRKTTKRINPQTGYPMSTPKSIEQAKETYNLCLETPEHEKTGNDSFDYEMEVSNKVLPRYSLGDLYYKEGEWDKAEKEWLSVIKLMAELPATRLAIMYHKEGRFNDEISIIEDGIKYGTDNPVYQLSGKLMNRLTKAKLNLAKNNKKDFSKGYIL